MVAHMRTVKTLVASLLLCGLLACEEPLTAAPRFAPVELALRQVLAQTSGATAATVSLVVEGEVLFAAAAGTRGGYLGAPKATPETLFATQSMTKSLTALAVLRLVREGRVDLDAPVQRYLPRWRLEATPERAAAITVRQLLNHTACIDDTAPLSPTGPTSDIVINEELPRVAASVCEPGRLWHYSNWGYWILGRLVEEVSGLPYPEYLRQHVLQPLGMSTSTFSLAQAAQGNFAPGYTRSALLDPLPLEQVQDSAWSLPAGGLFSNVLEFSRVMGAFESGPLLDEATRQQVRRSTVSTGQHGDAEHWGLGVAVYRQLPLNGLLYPLQALQHDGGYLGATATSVHFPERRLTVTVLTNAQWADFSPVLHAALQATGGLPEGQPYPATARPASDYLGVYENPLATARFQIKRLEVLERDGQLQVQGLRGDGPFSGPLRAVRDDLFYADTNFGLFPVVFIREDSGGVRYATNRVFVAERVSP